MIHQTANLYKAPDHPRLDGTLNVIGAPTTLIGIV